MTRSEINNPRGLRSVLAVRFSALGDVAMTVPVLYSVCACYPDVRFTFVTRSAMASIFINPPENLTVVGVNLDDYKGLGGLRRLFSELRRDYRFDAFVDLHDVLRTRVLRLLSRLHGITVGVINKGRKGKRALTRPHNKVLLPLISSRARYRQAFHSIGLPVESSFEGLYGADGKEAPAEAFASVSPDKLPGEKWIGIAPFAQHKGKIYPTELMEEVVKELVADPSHRIFLFGGGPAEQPMLSEWARKYPRVTSLADKRHGFAV